MFEQVEHDIAFITNDGPWLLLYSTPLDHYKYCFAGLSSKMVHTVCFQNLLSREVLKIRLM